MKALIPVDYNTCEVCGKRNKHTQPIYGKETCHKCYMKQRGQENTMIVHPDTYKLAKKIFGEH